MPDFAIFPSLKDKTVIVSGGASGIGGEIVRAFAAQGARVCTILENLIGYFTLGTSGDNVT